MDEEIKKIIWRRSKYAHEYPKDWYVIPALEVIEILEGIRRDTVVAENEIKGIVDNLNNERVATLIDKKGCGDSYEFDFKGRRYKVKCGDKLEGEIK